MLWIVLPVAVFDVVTIKIVVLIEVVIVVDLDVATVPIAIAPVAAPGAPSGASHCNSGAPHQSRSWYVARICVRIIRISWRRGPVHHRRVVGRHIHNIRVRLLDLDDLLAAAGNSLGLHYRLGVGF